MKLAVWSSLPPRMGCSWKTATVRWKSLVIGAKLCGICAGRIVGLVGRNRGRNEGNRWLDLVGNYLRVEPSVQVSSTIGATDTSHDGSTHSIRLI